MISLMIEEKKQNDGTEDKSYLKE